MGDDGVQGDVRALAGQIRSRTSTTPSTRPRPTTTIVGMPISSASLNFTPDRHPGAIVEQHPHAGRGELLGQRLGGVGLRLLAGGHDVHVGRRDRSRARSGPTSSWCCSAIAATARETPMP